MLRCCVRAGSQRKPGPFLFCPMYRQGVQRFAASYSHDERGVDKEDGVNCPSMQHEGSRRVMLMESNGSMEGADAERRLR